MATFLIDHFSNENSLWYLGCRLKVGIFFQGLPICWPFLFVKESCNRVTGSVLKRSFLYWKAGVIQLTFAYTIARFI